MYLGLTLKFTLFFVFRACISLVLLILLEMKILVYIHTCSLIPCINSVPQCSPACVAYGDGFLLVKHRPSLDSAAAV